MAGELRSSAAGHRLLAIGGVALGAAFYGSITVGGRIFAQRGFSLLEISLTGVLFGSFLLLPWVARGGHWVRRRDWPLFAFFGVVGAALQITQFAGIVLGVPVALVALLLYTQPLWTVLLGRLCLHEPITPRKVGAVVLALSGTLVLFEPWQRGAADHSPLGLAAALVAGFLLSLWVLLSRTSALRGNPPLTTSFGYMSCTAMTLLLAAPILRWLDPGEAAVRLLPAVWLVHWQAVALYTVAASVLPALLVMWGVRGVEASTAGVLLLLEPVSAALLAYLLLGEHPAGSAWIGGALILAANAVLLHRQGETISA